MKTKRKNNIVNKQINNNFPTQQQEKNKYNIDQLLNKTFYNIFTVINIERKKFKKDSIITIRDTHNNIFIYTYPQFIRRMQYVKNYILSAKRTINTYINDVLILDIYYKIRKKRLNIYAKIKDKNNNIQEYPYSKLKYLNMENKKLQQLLNTQIDQYTIINAFYKQNKKNKNILYVTVKDKKNNILNYNYAALKRIIKISTNNKTLIGTKINNYTIIDTTYKMYGKRHILYVTVKNDNNNIYTMPYYNVAIIANSNNKFSPLIGQIINDKIISEIKYNFIEELSNFNITIILKDKYNNIYTFIKLLNPTTTPNKVLNKIYELFSNKFNHLTILSAEYQPYKTTSRLICTCKCDCGKICKYIYSFIKNHDVHTCSCGKRKDLSQLINCKIGPYIILSAERKKRPADKQNNIYVQVKDKNNNIKELRYMYLKDKYINHPRNISEKIK